ncbi:MAG: class I SAM-dependent methyltransferase [Candidatus Cloacimonetes bacterium]|nr:class I SAM-dependent methyltransferase [Candidatus Cloacimonadota bacterium]
MTFKEFLKRCQYDVIRVNRDVLTKHKHKKELRYWHRKFLKEKLFPNWWYEKYFLAMAQEENDDFLKDKIVADFGCGPAGSLNWTEAPKLRLGIDVLADKYFDLFGREMIDDGYPYIKSTEKHILLPDEFVDVVFTFNAMDHTINFSEMLDEIFRILKTGGDFIGSFNLNEPPSIAEPQKLTIKMLERFLFPKLDIEYKKIALHGHFCTPKRNVYDVFFDEITVQPSDNERSILWIRGKKK